ncbi:MAG TPA: hypothetical protein PKI03_29700, partial [Pseudomonadota bacterium]|nr:hypothetical protein [Pseudomonadota bacterium]
MNSASAGQSIRSACVKDDDPSPSASTRPRGGAARQRIVGLIGPWSLVSLGVLAACGGGSPMPDVMVDPASPTSVREFIGQQVGGIAKLTVPPNDDAIPVPPDDPSRPGRYKTTAAKKFLGKLLFHDPVRTARVNVNTKVPLDLPTGMAFGGTVLASDPQVSAITAATKQTGSCGSCHIGEAAGKAGQVLNFNTGGEG